MRLFLLVALAVPAPALAGPTAIAQVKADLDGDGVEDEVRLTSEGVVVVASQGHHDTKFALTVKRGTIAASGPWIAVQADAGRGMEGIGLKYKAGSLTTVWRGPIGPVGVDAEYRIDLTATGTKLVRHQSRADVRRCDGKPALLFAEGWDEAARSFRALKLTPGVDPAAKVLTATRVTDPPPRPVVFAASEASTGAGASDAGALSAPRELDDGDVKTSWREDRGGDGRGEFITYRAVVRGGKARALWLTPDGGKGTNRVRKLGVVGADRAYWIEIPADAGAAYKVELPEPIGDCVSVVIGDVVKPKGTTGGGTTALGELVVLGDADLAPDGAPAALVAEVVRGGAGAIGATDMLVRLGGPGATAVVAALGAGGLARDVQLRLLKVLIRSRDPAGAAAIAAGITSVLHGPDVDDATRALAAMGPSAIAALTGLAGDARHPAEARTAALDALAEIPGAAATDALLVIAGTGPRAVRAAVTRALGKRPIAELLAATPPGPDAGQADRWRGIGLAGLRATDAERAPAIAALTTALATATDYELRYRLIQSVSSIGDDPALNLLDRALIDLPAGAPANGLHQVAALALARNPAGEATAILVRLAGHTDPGVRLRSIGALAQRVPGTVEPGGGTVIAPGAGSDDAIDRVLIGVLASDHWPELRKAAAGSLGERCQRPGPAKALDIAVDRDKELEVRGDALAGLVSCKATGIADRLLAIAVDGDAPLPLRERAVILIVALDDKRVEAPLIQLFERWRGAAYDQPEALALASRAAVALGRIGGAKSAAALEAALGDEALPELVSSVATGLGLLGAACPRTALAELKELAKSDQQMIAMSARRAVAQCGK